MPHTQDRKREYMKRKPLKVLRKGIVLESELPQPLRKHGPRWLRTWPKMKLIRGCSKEKPPQD